MYVIKRNFQFFTLAEKLMNFDRISPENLPNPKITEKNGIKGCKQLRLKMDFSHILLHIPMHRSVLALKCMFDPRHGLKLTKMIKTVKMIYFY